MTLAGVPVLSLSDYRSPTTRDAFVKAWGEGLREFGFVSIEHHGIAPELIRDTYDAARKFFAQPEAAKKAYELPGAGGQRGYTPFGREHAKSRKIADLKEFYHVGRDLPAGHPHRAGYGDNVFPKDVPEFQRTTQALFDALDGVAAQLLEALGLYFKIDPDTFVRMARGGNSILRPIHYPPLAPGTPPDAIRAAEHEDINLITLLCEGTAGGLQLLTRQGEWIDVETTQGRIVVDSGDMLQRVTNHVIPSTTHRVMNPPDSKNTDRYSIPFFVHPYPECVLECLPCCESKENPRKFPPITADAFLRERLREIGLLK